MQTMKQCKPYTSVEYYEVIRSLQVNISWNKNFLDRSAYYSVYERITLVPKTPLSIVGFILYTSVTDS